MVCDHHIERLSDVEVADLCADQAEEPGALRREDVDALVGPRRRDEVRVRGGGEGVHGARPRHHALQHGPSPSIRREI